MSQLGARLLSGVQWNILGQLAVLVVNFVSTPIILRHLGADGYALYTLMWTTMNYLTLLNLGTSLAAGTFTAQRRGQPAYPLGWFLRWTLFLQLALSLAGAIGLYLGRDRVAEFFCRTSPAVLALAPYIFVCVAAAIPAYFLLQLGWNVLFGLQRFAAQSVVAILQSSVVAVCAVAMIYLGFGSLKNIGIAFVVCHFLLAAAAIGATWSCFFQPGRPQPQEVKEYVQYSWRVQLSQIVLLIVSQGDRIFLAALVSLSALGHYAVASSLAQKFNLLCGAVAVTAYPMLAELYGQKDEPRLRRFYLKTTEVFLFINLPVSIISFILVPQFMTLWLGPEFSAVVSWPFRLLLWSNVAYLTAQLPVSLVGGQGHPHVVAVYQAFKAAVTVLAWPWLIARWGILGAAAGPLIGECIGAPLFIGYAHRRFLKLGWAEYWSQSCYRPVVAGLGLTAVGWLMRGAVSTWLGMAVFGGVGLGVFFAVGYRLLDGETRALLHELVGAKLRKFRA